MKDFIKCPKCLKENDQDELEKNTEYNCWSSEYTDVYCLHCDSHFEVYCEHRGYEPAYDTFDLRAFKKFHNVKVPEGISSIFMDSHLRNYIDGETPIVGYEKDDKYKKISEEALKVAESEWNRIQKSINGSEDNEALV